MASASLPSLSLRLQPADTSHLHFTPKGLKSELLRSHHQQRAATIQSQRRKVSSRPRCFGTSNESVEPHSDSHLVPHSHPLSDLARDFYSAINNKDTSKLDSFVADNCVFEDLAFPKPFEGKEVHRFLKQLTEAMGKHMCFAIEGVYEGGEKYVGVLWHLEWNSDPIPFSKGCSFFECSRKGQKLHIKRARVFVESPLKPGEIVLEVLKVISLLLDKFPKLADNILHRPNLMVQLIMRAYKMFVEPFILPFLFYYTHLWTFAARVISYLLIIVQNLLKFFM